MEIIVYCIAAVVSFVLEDRLIVESEIDREELCDFDEAILRSPMRSSILWLMELINVVEAENIKQIRLLSRRFQ